MNEVQHVFPAIFEYCDNSYTVIFPDLPGCITEGNTIEESLKMAKEALELHLYNIEDEKEIMPIPSKTANIKINKHSFIRLIEV